MPPEPTTISPWSPYRVETFPRSQGRVTLAEALTNYMLLQHGIGAADIADAFDEPGDDRTRDLVGMGARLIADQLLDGRFTTYARPLGGGEPMRLAPHVWELDDVLARFATSAMDPRRPFDAGVAPTNRIFIDEADVAALYEAVCHDLPKPPSRARSAPAIPDPDGQPEPAPADVLAGGRLLRLPEVEGMVGMKKSTIYDRIKAGRFPAPVASGSRISVWREDEVRTWMADPR